MSLWAAKTRPPTGSELAIRHDAMVTAMLQIHDPRQSKGQSKGRRNCFHRPDYCWITAVRDSGGGSDLFIALGGPRLTDPAAWLGGHILRLLVARADRRRQHGERDPLVAFILGIARFVPRGAIAAKLLAVAALEALPAALASPLLAAILARTLAGFDLAVLVARLAFGGHLLVAIGVGVIFLIVAARTALALLLL